MKFMKLLVVILFASLVLTAANTVPSQGSHGTGGLVRYTVSGGQGGGKQVGGNQGGGIQGSEKQGGGNQGGGNQGSGDRQGKAYGAGDYRSHPSSVGGGDHEGGR